jgi:hypothetical protein
MGLVYLRADESGGTCPSGKSKKLVVRGGWVDDMIFALLGSDWKAKRAAGG